MFSHILNSATLSPFKSNRRPARKTAAPSQASSTHAKREISAYIALRDMQLAEAEERPDAMNLSRAGAANDYVNSCLKPARSPYEAECLLELDAARERERCAAVKVRLAKLRARLAA